ncbi:type 4b pilus protein PilO2 [Paraburkholderia sediminicola]|uniref:type 4b pilus protein PilO2 n=1 Tax=Paraburkholderia sediminicola TaxID=458836 RepID=UPI0038BC46FC
MMEPTYSGEYFGAASANDHPTVGRTELVTIGHRKWLIGMRWRSYEVLPDRGELAEEAETMRTDWIARRLGDEAIQVGFCEAVNKRWPRKIFSLAALLADSHKVPWAGAFDLGDGLWWYIAVRDNYGMMPDGDVVGTREDIDRARQEHASLEDFNHVNGTRAQLEELIARAKAKRTPLESLTASRFSPKVVLGSLGAIAVATAGYFGYQYYEHVQEQTRQALVRQQIQENARKAQQATAPDAGKILRSLPDPAVWLAACGQAVNSQPLWREGWHLIGQHCEGSQLLVTWKRGPGATIAYAPPGVISDDGNLDVQTVPLQLPAGVPGADDSVPLREAHDRLTLWAQQHDIAVGMTVVVPPAPKQNDPAAMAAAALGTNTPTPVPSIQISFSVPAAPFALDFSDLPGLRLSDVSLDDVTAKTSDASHGWKISGVVYGR